MELRQRALQVLCIADPQKKAAQALQLQSPDASLLIAPEAPPAVAELPGRPARPELIHPSKVARRSPFTPEGLAALLHAIAHIEFNAINLALDAVWRFDGMPPRYYADWASVAAEEAYHFSLLRDHLASLGRAYGDFPAHDNLWAMCEKTKDDVVARMALVPRTLEARGLDASPLIQQKLRLVGTPDAMRAVDILEIILRDEVGHVAIGNHWYRWLCERDGVDPVAHYGVLVERHDAPRLYPPFNEEARRRAGFTDAELARLLEPGPGYGGHQE
ncbi:MAG: ferritin-like domain-containing protein [Ramlibacter sp.]